MELTKNHKHCIFFGDCHFNEMDCVFTDPHYVCKHQLPLEKASEFIFNLMKENEELSVENEDTLSDIRQEAKEFGYVLVPIEPTEAMMQAGFDTDDDGMDAVAIYKAMLKAAVKGCD